MRHVIKKVPVHQEQPILANMLNCKSLSVLHIRAGRATRLYTVGMPGGLTVRRWGAGELLLKKILLIVVLVEVGRAWNGEFRSTRNRSLITNAEARIGRLATQVSYAGVARRTTVRVATPGVGRPANRGSPVNRVGRR